MTNNKTAPVFFILMLLFESCSIGKKEIPVNSLGDVLTNLAPTPETFEIDPAEEITLTGTKGTVVYIPVDAFQFADGTTPTSKVSIELKECYTLSSMIAENMSTTSGPHILETAGMIYVNASADGKPLSIKEGKAFVIGFPKANKTDEMDLFYDVQLGDTISTWVPDHKMYLVDATTSAGGDSIQGDGMEGYTVYPIKITDDLFDYDFWLRSDASLFDLPLKGQNKTMIKYIEDQKPTADSLARKFYQNRWSIGFKFNIDKNGKITNLRVDEQYPDYDTYALGIFKGYFKNAPALDLSVDTIKVDHNRDYTVGIFGTRQVNEERYKKRFREQYSQYTTQAIQKMDKNALDYYMFSATKMGWINCDKFWDIDEEKKTNFVVKIASPKDAKVQIVFKDIKSIMTGAYEDGQVVFRNVPLGKKIKIIGINYSNGKPTMALKETTIDKNGVNLTAFKEFSIDELETELNKVN